MNQCNISNTVLKIKLKDENLHKWNFYKWYNYTNLEYTQNSIIPNL